MPVPSPGTYDVASQVSLLAVKAKTDLIGASVALEGGGNLAAVKAKTDIINVHGAEIGTHIAPNGMTEVDPGALLTETYHRVTVTGETTNVSYLVQAFTPPATNFSIEFIMNMTAAGANGMIWPLILGNINAAWNNAGFAGVGLYTYITGTILATIAAGVATDMSTTITTALTTVYYGRLTVYGNVCTLEIFSDAARTAHVSQSPIQVSVAGMTFAFIYLAENYITGGLNSKSAYVEKVFVL